MRHTCHISFFSHIACILIFFRIAWYETLLYITDNEKLYHKNIVFDYFKIIFLFD